MKYNAKKSEILIIYEGKRISSHVPPVALDGETLNILHRYAFRKYCEEDLGNVEHRDTEIHQERA